MINCPYEIITFFSQEDKCWIADAPQLKLGGGFGSTPEEAITDFEIVFDMFCKTQAEDGEPLPDPVHKVKV